MERRVATPSGPNEALLTEPALLAMIAVGVLRLGSEAWTASTPQSRPDAYTHQVFDQTWRCLAKLANEDR